MNGERLTAILAEKVMGWTVGPDRFLMGGRRWLPRWRFQPTERLVDALRLLEATAPERYEISSQENGILFVRLQIPGSTGEARDRSKPRAITLAIARALQIEPCSRGCSGFVGDSCNSCKEAKAGKR